jgi:hypothetical protein
VDTLLKLGFYPFIFDAMQRSGTCGSLKPSDMDLNPTFNVVIAYEDFETGKNARKTYDFLVAHLGNECQFSNQMWKFDVLSVPKLREIAAKDACAADIIIISCRSGELPDDVKAWIELWIGEENHPLALAALFEYAPDDLYQTREPRAYLASVAKRGQMEFFAQPEEWLPRNADLLTRERDAASDKTLSALAGLVERDERAPRWGLNE